ncbi:uncharacterized protein BT62DRAFT_921504 [Guyanagaster necrorhizus]|uniref:Uncharacterized protein n=1 Tax=Guyanagaster necrorhizus TaxID=856835 RepID=A0A9P7VNE8_9AGAR|nr:uncharacterized protein BT62DRAFT_921504 [Guyanagaster necrorhizus MCA 3950]KAG7443837.1 hypothetical protein BT62DRAFT_921504 [Guyanagaster necrorhizus MCA 3950]
MLEKFFKHPVQETEGIGKHVMSALAIFGDSVTTTTALQMDDYLDDGLEPLEMKGISFSWLEDSYEIENLTESSVPSFSQSFRNDYLSDFDPMQNATSFMQMPLEDYFSDQQLAIPPICVNVSDLIAEISTSLTDLVVILNEDRFIDTAKIDRTVVHSTSSTLYPGAIPLKEAGSEVKVWGQRDYFCSDEGYTSKHSHSKSGDSSFFPVSASIQPADSYLLREQTVP